MKERCLRILDYISEYSLYGLILFLPISKAAIEIFASLAFMAFIGKKILKPDFSFLKSKANIFLLFFIIFSALSLFNSGPYFKKSFTALFFKWLEYIGIFLFVQDTFFIHKRINNAVFILLIMAGLVGVDGITQRLSGTEFLRHRPIVEAQKGLFAISGPFNHYNDFGVYLVVILSLALAVLISEKFSYIFKTILLILGIFLGICLILTFSRGSWLGFICILFFMLYHSNKVKELVPILAIFIIVMVFSPILRERAMFTLQATGDADRFIVWQSALRMIKENPFLGKGIGTFMDYFHTYVPNKNVQYAHNCYLQIWAETGVFSLLSFLLFIGSILYRGITNFKQKSDYLLLGFVCALIGFLIQSFFDTYLYSLQLAMLFWFMSGLTAAVTQINSKIGK